MRPQKNEQGVQIMMAKDPTESVSVLILKAFADGLDALDPDDVDAFDIDELKEQAVIRLTDDRQYIVIVRELAPKD